MRLSLATVPRRDRGDVVDGNQLRIAAPEGEVAFVFAGQGSQLPGMGRPWRNSVTWVWVERASDLLGIDVDALLTRDDADLRSTVNCQIAVFVLGVVVSEALRAADVKPDVVAGHSLGEYAALVAAGVLTFDDAVVILRHRGEAIASAVDGDDHQMVSIIGVTEGDALAICAQLEDVSVASINGPELLVIGGRTGAVSRAVMMMRAVGGRAPKRLDVAGAFHTRLMRPALRAMTEALASLRVSDASCPAVSSIDGAMHVEAEEWRRLLATQFVTPVRWGQVLHALDTRGVSLMVEIGAKPVLGPISRRVLPHVQSVHVADRDSPNSLRQRLVSSPGIVRSPADGLFVAEPARQVTCEGEFVSSGQILGHLSGLTIRAPASGFLLEIAPSGAIAKTGDVLARVKQASH